MKELREEIKADIKECVRECERKDKRAEEDIGGRKRNEGGMEKRKGRPDEGNR